MIYKQLNVNILKIVCSLIVILLAGCGTTKPAISPTTDVQQHTGSLLLTDSLLTHLLGRFPQYFDTLLRNNNQWGIQIIYTQIDRNADNAPKLKNYYYNVNPQQYFYPASTVKLPAAALALQKVNELKLTGLDKYSTMITEAESNGQTAVYNDPTSADGRPTIAHYIKKILLVSDNDAFNRLYEFLGQEYFNNHLHQMGFDSVQILHRLSVPLTEAQNRITNPVKFYDTAGNLLYQQPMVNSNMQFATRKNLLGHGYYSGNQLVNEPFDFSRKNRLSLPDLHSILQSLLFPETVSKKQQFNLTDDDYRFLYRYMSMYPAEADYPQYDTTYKKAYVKFLLYGAKDPVNPDIRIFNKVGDAYGFLTDAAYIIDTRNGVEFLLSATIHCNSDGIYNDDRYDYETVGFPFMKNLGQVIYDYELNRSKTHAPQFNRFLIK